MTTEEGLRSFDVTALPTDLVAQITVPILRSIDQNRLAEAIKVIQSRLLSLEANQHAIAQASPAMPTTAGIDDEDEYEPDFEPMEDTEQLLNKSDILPSEEMQKEAADLKLELERYELPKPKPMTPDEAIEMAKFYAVRVFNLMASLPYGPKRPQQGWVRTAASTFDKAAWATILTRLATRGPRSDPDDVEAGEGSVPKGDGVANFIREMLWKWIVEDFRVHFSIAMDWLVEEYWCEACQFEERTGSMKRPDGSFAPTPTTHKWALKLLDAVIPYLDAKDHKWFTRFWSESPIVTAEMLERVKAVARDPERTTMAVNSL
jgi:symplekin